MAERENIRSRLKKHQLTQVWLINQLWQVCSIIPVKRKTVLWSQEQDGRGCAVSALLF